MSEQLWFDIFAYIGMACVACTVVLVLLLIGSDIRQRRRFNRESREFNEQMRALTRVWERNPDV